MLATFVVNYDEGDGFTYHVNCEKSIILPEDRVEEFKETYNIKVLEITDHNEAIFKAITLKQDSIRDPNFSYEAKSHFLKDIGSLRQQLLCCGGGNEYAGIAPLEVIELVLEEMDCQKYQESIKHFHLDEKTAFIE